MHTVAGPDSLNDPEAVLAAPDGSVYIADTGNNRIRRITPAGVLTTVAGTGHPGFSGDNGAATGAELNGPTGQGFRLKVPFLLRRPLQRRDPGDGRQGGDRAGGGQPRARAGGIG